MWDRQERRGGQVRVRRRKRVGANQALAKTERRKPKPAVAGRGRAGFSPRADVCGGAGRREGTTYADAVRECG